jgi:hypothetical protein
MSTPTSPSNEKAGGGGGISMVVVKELPCERGPRHIFCPVS